MCDALEIKSDFFYVRRKLKQLKKEGSKKAWVVEQKAGNDGYLSLAQTITSAEEITSAERTTRGSEKAKGEKKVERKKKFGLRALPEELVSLTAYHMNTKYKKASDKKNNGQHESIKKERSRT